MVLKLPPNIHRFSADVSFAKINLYVRVCSEWRLPPHGAVLRTAVKFQHMTIIGHSEIFLICVIYSVVEGRTPLTR